MDWREQYKGKLTTAKEAVKAVKPGDRVIMSNLKGRLKSRTGLESLWVDDILGPVTLGKPTILPPEISEDRVLTYNESPYLINEDLNIKEGATILKQAHEIKFTPKWLMGSASKSPKLVELAGVAAEGGIGTYPTFAKEGASYEHYKTAFEAKYPDQKLPIFGEYNYDMVHLLAKALNNARDMTADSIRAALIESSKGYMGVTGDKPFDENGDVGATYGRWMVEEGKIVEK